MTIRRTKITPCSEEYQTLGSNVTSFKMIGGNSSIYNQTAQEYKKQRLSQPKNKPRKTAHLISIIEGKAYNWYVLKNTGSVVHALRSEEHTSELQSLMRISYAVFCLKHKRIKT